MNKKEIVKQFLEKGILLSPESLQEIDEAAFQPKNQAVLQRPEKTQEEPGIKINKRKIKEKTRLTTADFAKYYSNKYESLREIIQKKTPNALSINNAKNEQSKISIISMVKELTGQGFAAEDPTGEIEVVSRQAPSDDDVVGVTGIIREGKLFADEIIYPDVPIIREIGSIDTTILLTTKQTDTSSITPESNPQHIELTQNKNKITILSYKPKNQIDKNKAIELLKKRHLSPTRSEIKTTEDVFVIDPIPEIFWIISHEKWSHIYKSILILSCEQAKVNLKTKEFELLG